jgi:hypothetical protein
MKTNPRLHPRVLDALMQDALAAGLDLGSVEFDQVPVSGGKSSAFGAALTLRAPFHVKADDEGRKPADEARLVRRWKSDLALPAIFRDALPKIYAVRDEAPSAFVCERYAPQDGYLTLQDRLFRPAHDIPPSAAQTTRMLDAVLDRMLPAYRASLDRRLVPNPAMLLERMRSGFERAAALDQRLASRQLWVNDQALRPWAEKLAALDARPDLIAKLAAVGSTLVHGDLNPANLILRVDASGIEVHVIDPSLEATGDYLVDVARLIQFIATTCPVQFASKPHEPIAVRWEGDGTGLRYTVPEPDWIAPTMKAVFERLGDFAGQIGDNGFQPRLELAMAADFAGRLGRAGADDLQRRELEWLWFGEAQVWLDRLCKQLFG